VAPPEGRDVAIRFFIVEPDRAGLVELGRLADAGRVRVEVAATFPLEEAPAAYELGRAGKRRGKLVIDVRGGPAGAG
jgi:NADPH:quinone reductase-like Zn-dependent oxidoreductase